MAAFIVLRGKYRVTRLPASGQATMSPPTKIDSLAQAREEDWGLTNTAPYFSPFNLSVSCAFCLFHLHLLTFQKSYTLPRKPHRFDLLLATFIASWFRALTKFFASPKAVIYLFLGAFEHPGL